MAYLHSDREWLSKKYLDEKLSQEKIAKLSGVTQGAIWRALKKFNIPTRTVSEANSGNKNGSWKDNPIKDRNTFYQAYVIEDLGLGGVAKKFGVSKRTAARWRKEHDIEAHDKSRWHRNNLKTMTDNPNWKGGPSYCGCGNIKTSTATVCGDCHYLHLKMATGKRNRNYRGKMNLMMRIRSYVAEYWRPRIFERDGYTCMSCGDNRGGNLHAHHIKRLRVIVDEILGDVDFKSNDEFERGIQKVISHPDVLDLNNGVTLCTTCHIEIHCGTRKDVVPIIRSNTCTSTRQKCSIS